MTLVYKHIRKDTNEVFYIGIGNEKRPYSKKNRNQYWKNIVNKVGYRVEIIQENLSWEVACKLEKQLIKKYGRKDLNEGTVVNMTDGGDGTTGAKLSKSTCKKMSDYAKTRKWSTVTKKKMSKSAMGNTVNSGIKKTEDHKRKISEAHKKLNQDPEFRRLRGDRLRGYKQTEEHIAKRRKRVLQYDKNYNLIRVFESRKEAAEITNTSISGISSVVRGSQKTAGGYIWKYQ